MKEEKNSTLEEMLGELDNIVKVLESDDISLEESFKLYKKGVELTQACNATIDRVEKEVLRLEDNGDTYPLDSKE